MPLRNAGRKEQPDTQVSDVPVGCLGLAFTEQQQMYHIPAWCPGGCNEGGRDDVTQLTNSQSRHQGHINAARHVAQATELATVATNNCGS